MSSANASSFMAATMKAETAEESTLMAMPTSLDEWREVESGHYEYILDDEPAPKAKVVLPAVTRGVVNLSTVQRLQDKLEFTETELKKLKETAIQDKKTLQLQVQSKVEKQLKFELEGIKDELRKEKTRELSIEQVLNLLEHPVVIAKMNGRLQDSIAENTKRLEAEFQSKVEKAKKQVSEDEIQEMLKSNPTAIAIFNANLQKHLEVAKKELSDTEIREMLRSNTLAREIFSGNLNKRLQVEKTKLEAQFQERIETAKKQLSDTEIREMLQSNLTARDIFGDNLSKRLEEHKIKIRADLTAEFEDRLRSAKYDIVSGKASGLLANENNLSKAVATQAVPTPVKKEFSFGIGVSRLTTPFRYPVAPLGSSPKSTSPVVFGAASKPRSPLEVMSSAFSSPNIPPHSSPKPKTQLYDKAKLPTSVLAPFKRLRDIGDIGGIEGGPKKIRKDESME